MNKKNLLFASLFIAALIHTNHSVAQGVPDTIVLNDIPTTKSTTGCTKTAPCKFKAAYIGEESPIMVGISGLAARIAGTATKMVNAGAVLNVRGEKDQTRYYLKLPDAEEAGGAQLYCSQGSTALAHEPVNNWAFKFNSLGPIRMWDPVKKVRVTVTAAPPSVCYIVNPSPEIEATFNSLVDNNNMVMASPISSQNLPRSTKLIRDNTIGGSIFPTVAIKDAERYLKTNGAD